MRIHYHNFKQNIFLIIKILDTRNYFENSPLSQKRRKISDDFN